MEITLSGISRAFWSPQIWLPKNCTWNIIIKYNKYDIKYAFVYPIYIAVCLALIKRVFDKMIGIPLFESFFINDKDKQPSCLFKNQSLLECLYMHITGESILEVKNCKSIKEPPPKLKKATECCFRLIFYVFILIYGFKALHTKPWMWNSKEFWLGYPYHVVSDKVYWYYSIKMGFFILDTFKIIIARLYGVERKDFWLMLFHHSVAMSCIFFTYACNFTRTGSFTIFIHDWVEIWYEFGKLASYLGFQLASDISFSIFTFVWFASRILIFPYRVVYSTIVDFPPTVGEVYTAVYFFNLLLYLIFVMNLIWFGHICHKAYDVLLKGDIIRDDLSEFDEAGEIENLDDIFSKVESTKDK